MQLAILVALAVAWVLVLLPGRHTKRVRLGSPGFGARNFGRRGFGKHGPDKRRLGGFAPTLSPLSAKNFHPAGSHFLPSARQRPAQPGLPYLGNPRQLQKQPRLGFRQPNLPADPWAATQRSSSATATPRTTAEAALRRRDITMILLGLSLVTLAGLFLTRQVWLGVVHIGIDMALVGYRWLIARNESLYRSG